MKKFIEYTTPVQEKYDGMVGDPVILQPGGVNLYYVGQQISSFIAVPGTVGSKGAVANLYLIVTLPIIRAGLRLRQEIS